MCDPVTMAVLTVAKGVSDYEQGVAEAQATQARFDANRLAANDARDLKVQTLNQRMIQESEAAAEEKLRLGIAAMEGEGRALVSSGEAGVTGNSIDLLLQDYEAQKLRGTTTINRNLENVEKQIELEKRGASAEALNRTNSLQQGVMPNFLAAAVGTAASAAGAYNSAKVDIPKSTNYTFADNISTSPTSGYWSSGGVGTQSKYGWGNDNSFE
jgi:hypothetical protein